MMLQVVWFAFVRHQSCNLSCTVHLHVSIDQALCVQSFVNSCAWHLQVCVLSELHGFEELCVGSVGELCVGSVGVRISHAHPCCLYAFLPRPLWSTITISYCFASTLRSLLTTPSSTRAQCCSYLRKSSMSLHMHSSTSRECVGTCIVLQ